MTKHVIIALTIAIALSGMAAADDQQVDMAVALKEHAVVTGDVIRLADVAELGDAVASSAASVSLGNAPWPGHVREISRALVKVRLVSAGYDLTDFDFIGTAVCQVALESVQIGRDELVAAARKYLEKQFAGGDADVRIELARQVSGIHVPAGGLLELRPELVGTRAPIGSVRMDVNVIRNGIHLKRVPVSFNVRLYRRVAVASRAIGSGSEFTSRNTTLTVRDVTDVRGDCFESLGAIAGKVAQQAVQPGQIIVKRAVGEAEPPIVVEAHQRVFLCVRTRTLQIVTLGKALSRARLGQIARARNLVTGREVVGVAIGEGTIHVSMGDAIDER